MLRLKPGATNAACCCAMLPSRQEPNLATINAARRIELPPSNSVFVVDTLNKVLTQHRNKESQLNSKMKKKIISTRLKPIPKHSQDSSETKTN